MTLFLQAAQKYQNCIWMCISTSTPFLTKEKEPHHMISILPEKSEKGGNSTYACKCGFWTSHLQVSRVVDRGPSSHLIVVFVTFLGALFSQETFEEFLNPVSSMRADTASTCKQKDTLYL